MSEKVLSDAGLDELRRASRRAALVSMLGFLFVLGAMAYAVFSLSKLEHARQQLEIEEKRQAESVKHLEDRVRELQLTQEGVLDFLGGVTSQERFRLVDPSVDWPRAKAALLSMEAGPRKSAVLDAILLAWKNLPFSLEDRSLGRGLDSPHFINVVLSSAGVYVEQEKNERLSDAMMRQFQKVDSPLPGDLIFYRGNVGSFVVMYISPGSPEGKGVAIGTLQTGEEVMVLDTRNINTPVYPFIGIFRVPYPSTAIRQKAPPLQEKPKSISWAHLRLKTIGEGRGPVTIRAFNPFTFTITISIDDGEHFSVPARKTLDMSVKPGAARTLYLTGRGIHTEPSWFPAIGGNIYELTFDKPEDRRNVPSN